MASLSLTVVDIVILMLGAIVLGITIHFFITSRKNLKANYPGTNTNSGASNRVDMQSNEWKLKYLNEVEVKDKEIIALRDRITELEENSNIFSIEAEEVRKQNKKLQTELESSRKASNQVLTSGQRPDYFQQLRDAQASLEEHNEKINQLLSNIDVIKETEEKQQEILRDNEELSGQIEELRLALSQKEQEISTVRQKVHLSKEMSSMLDNAYTEFGSLQEKMQKLELQVSTSKKINMEYEDIKEEHQKLRRDFDEQKVKLNAFHTENKDLLEQVTGMEEELKEAHFQRQQLQKRVAYLEELNQDLQDVSDANKRLEGQIKRIGELESMLNVISEERDQLIRNR